MSSIKVLLKKVEGNAHHDCHLLNGVDSAGRLLGPPRFGFVQVGLDRGLLCRRKIEFVDPSGDRALGQRAWEMSGQPRVGVSWNGEETIMVQMQVEQVEHWPLAEAVGWEVPERMDRQASMRLEDIGYLQPVGVVGQLVDGVE